MTLVLQHPPVEYDQGLTAQNHRAIELADGENVKKNTARTRTFNTYTADITLGLLNDVVLVDASGGAITIRLPLASAGKIQFDIYKDDLSANAVTIDGNGSETINGALTFVLASPRETVRVASDGIKWRIL